MGPVSSLVALIVIDHPVGARRHSTTQSKPANFQPATDESTTIGESVKSTATNWSSSTKLRYEQLDTQESREYSRLSYYSTMDRWFTCIGRTQIICI